jgi:hypothetical protein
MPLFDDEDLDALARDLGTVTFTIDETAAKGFLDDREDPVLAGEGARQIGERLVGRVRTGALEGLEVGAAITVAGSGAADGTYVVNELRKIGNGQRTEIVLGVV